MATDHQPREINSIGSMLSVMASARHDPFARMLNVDLVAVFEEDTPIDLIAKVTPSVLVKGGDYTREQVVGHEIVEAAGGEVVLVDILPGHSTTSLVDRARGGKA